MIPTSEDVTDATLMERSAGGDQKAFAVIVSRHGPFALRVAARLVADPDIAEDVAQEAMVRAWTQADKFHPDKARLTTWLYRIVVNLCIDQMRRTKTQRWPETFDPADPATNAEENMQTAERQSALNAALRTLPERQRIAMTLVYDEGLSGRDTADILGISAKAVERLLARARASLKTCLQPSQKKEAGTC